jgi:hypothetical protein
VPTLDEINALSPASAEKFFLSCSGSTRWAGSMAACRPYWSIHVVFNAAEVIWEYLGAEDWREALRARAGIDAGMDGGEFAEELDLYRSKFGYEFVIAPPLPARDGLLAALRARLEHPQRVEIDTAAAHERAIMRSALREQLTP